MMFGSNLSSKADFDKSPTVQAPNSYFLVPSSKARSPVRSVLALVAMPGAPNSFAKGVLPQTYSNFSGDLVGLVARDEGTEERGSVRPSCAGLPMCLDVER